MRAVVLVALVCVSLGGAEFVSIFHSAFITQPHLTHSYIVTLTRPDHTYYNMSSHKRRYEDDEERSSKRHRGDADRERSRHSNRHNSDREQHSGYTNKENPFGDGNLTQRFEWRAKEKKLKEQGADPRRMSKEQEQEREEEIKVCC